MDTALYACSKASTELVNAAGLLGISACHKEEDFCCSMAPSFANGNWAYTQAFIQGSSLYPDINAWYPSQGRKALESQFMKSARALQSFRLAPPNLSSQCLSAWLSVPPSPPLPDSRQATFPDSVRSYVHFDKVGGMGVVE